MEDVLQKVSNDHKTLYFSSQLKVIDVTQNLRSMGLKLNINELKIATSQTFNNYCMLQKIFEESNLTHLFHLIKSINQNYNSIITILLERTNKKGPAFQINSSNITKKQNLADNSIDILPSPEKLLKDIKKNKLGGIHLHNQNYTRYLEDNRILEQIKSQKQRRLHRNKMDLLRDSIFEELNHKTDVQQTPAKNDEITNYILRSKDKNSIFNYVSYQSELQQILCFFQNCQNQANDFLIRKGGRMSQQEDKFSFSDFQRDIHLKNITIKKNIADKIRQFLEKYRLKEKELEIYISEKQSIFKKLEEKYFKKEDQSIQTDVNMDQILKNHERQLKEIQIRCLALENIKRQQIQCGEKENQLLQQLALRQNHIQKQNSKINQLERIIDYVKKLLREQKSKKPYSTKEVQLQRSEKIIAQISKQQKMSEKLKDGNESQQINLQILQSTTSAHQLRKTSYMNNTWLRKQSNDISSYMSTSDLQKLGKEHQYLSKTDKKKFVRYNLENKLTDPEKLTQTKTNEMKVRKVQSSQFSVQTENRLQDSLEKMNLKKTMEQKQQQSTVSIPNDDEIDIKSIKSNKSIKNNKKKEIMQNPPKTSLKNLEGSLQKKVNKKNNNKNMINFVNQPNQEQYSLVSLETLKKLNKTSIKITNKQQSKLQKLNFTNQYQPEEQKSTPGLKIIEKKEQLEYKIFQVVEEDAQQQRQTMKNSQRSEKIISYYPHKKQQLDLYQKLNRQLSRIKKQKEYSFNHLYDLTIYPKGRVNNSINLKEQIGGEQKQDSQQYQKDRLNLNNNQRQWSSFEEKVKEQIKMDPKKKEKMMNWKKKIICNLNSSIINDKEVQHIMSIVNSSSNQFKHSSAHQNLISPISSISHKIRKSMPDIENQVEIKSTVKDLGNLKKNKLKTSSDQTQRLVEAKKQNCSFTPEIQHKIDYMIKYESFHSNFRQKFVNLHKKCKEGPLCSHINKYFDTIMKQYQERKKKQKQPIILPVQHIGNETQLESSLSKDYTLPHKKSFQNMTSLGKQIKAQKQASLNRVKNRNARLRYSQQLTLPSIKEGKLAHNNLRT